MPSPSERLRSGLITFGALAGLAAGTGATAQAGPGCWPPPRPGSDAELYLRTLQLTGDARVTSVSLLGDGDCAARLDSAARHPRAAGEAAPASNVAVVPLEISARYNSAFPFGYNDGPVWAGRGLTVAGSGGVALRAGPATLQLAPEAFWAENREFELAPILRAGVSRFADPVSPGRIDAPQRFGDEAYHRVAPGESFLRLDVGPVALGASTATQRWGPSVYQPLILGTNAGGFPHLFLGTSGPRKTPLGAVHGRAVWGRLGQSAYSPVPADSGGRFATGLVLALSPALLPGLEIGGARFFHVPLAERGVRARDWLKVFDPFSKGSLPDEDGTGSRSSADNQLASLFFRWVLPSIRTELYGEYAREDHNWDSRDLLMEPDHQAAYTLGLRGVLSHTPGTLWVISAEVQNALASHLAEVRQQPPFYQHGGARQGHTQRGQVLGAPFAHGGGGAIATLAREGRSSTLGLSLLRARMDQAWTFAEDSTVRERSTDVLYAAAVEGSFRGRGWELLGWVGAALEVNRHFARDAGNLGARVGVRLAP